MSLDSCNVKYIHKMHIFTSIDKLQQSTEVGFLKNIFNIKLFKYNCPQCPKSQGLIPTHANA